MSLAIQVKLCMLKYSSIVSATTTKTTTKQNAQLYKASG